MPSALNPPVSMGAKEKKIKNEDGAQGPAPNELISQSPAEDISTGQKRSKSKNLAQRKQHQILTFHRLRLLKN
jgi:hypothetical protein